MGYDLISVGKKKNSSKGYSLMEYAEKSTPTPATNDSSLKMMSSHNSPTYEVSIPEKSSSTWDKIKAGDIKGLVKELSLGLSHGLSTTGTARQNEDAAKILSNSNLPFMSDIGKTQLSQIKSDRDYLEANPVKSLPAMIGEQIPQIPLWMAGEGAIGAVGKGISKLSPRIASTAEKVGDKLPSFIKGGLKDAATYGAVVAPTENIREGGSLQDLIEKEKQLPIVALGGVAARGAIKGIGEGTQLVKDAIKPLGVPAERFGPIRPPEPITRSVQRELGTGPLKITDTLTPEYKARQSELQRLFGDLPVGSVDTPMARRTLQENIDNSLGINTPKTEYQGLEAFGKPLKIFRKNTDTQDAITEITSRMTKQVNDIADSLKQVDGQTKIESIRKQVKDMGGIRQANDGIFEERRVIPNWIRNDRTGRPLDEVADTLGMNSDELLAAIGDSAYKPKDYTSEAFRIANSDPEYQALSNTLDVLKSQLPVKKRLGPIGYTDKPELINQKQWYHGTGTIGLSPEKLNANMTKIDGLFGQGIYLTDNPEIAKGYANARSKSTNTPTVYNTKVEVNKVLDLQKQMPQDAYSVLENEAKRIDDYYYNEPTISKELKELHSKGVPGEELWSKFSDEVGILSHQEMQPISEFYDYFDDITAGLKDNGYDAFTHVGGKRTGNKPHQVLIMLDPTNRISEGVNTGKVTNFEPATQFPKILTKEDIKLKPRELTPKPEPLPIQPQRMTLSGNLPAPDAPFNPVKTLKQQVNTPLRTPTGRAPNLGETTDIEIPVINGRADVANTLEVPRIRTMNAGIERPTDTLTLEPVRPNSNNQINQLTQGTTNKIVGAEPNIAAGLKERGVSENIRTDANRPDALRDSYSADPLVYKQLGNKETLAKAQSIFDKGLEPAITELDTLIKELKPEAAPLVKMLADKLTTDGNIVRARELLSNAANRATESGQFGQAFRILRDADPETFLMSFDKMLKKLNKEGAEKYGKKWKDFDLTPDEITLVNGIERGNQASYDSVFEQIQSRIANEMPATAMEKINAWRHMSMLLNPKTHIRNVAGNAIMMGMRKAAQRTSGVLQKVLLPESERTQSVLVDKEFKDLASQYFEANKKDLLGGANKYQDNVSVSMPNKRVFKNNALEKTRKFNYELLQKGDNPFFQNAYTDRLASYAQAKGVRDFSKLGQEAFDTARLEAEQATYKDASLIADFINKAKRTDKNSSIGRKAGAVLTEAALPFTKTPINIIKRGLQYSPLGIVNGLAGINSSKGAAMAIDEMAKGLTGTGILGLGYLLASKGILTGKASSDADLKAYDSNTGNSPFSVLGKYSYDWAQPFSVPLSVGVEIYNAIKDNPKDLAKMNSAIQANDTTRFQQMALTAANGIMEGLNASGDTVFNMSIMKGIKTLLGSGKQGFMEGLAQLPQNYATQFIPTALSQLAGTVDPLTRQTYVKGDMPQSFKNAIVSRIPFASKTLEPKQTPFGDDIKKIENPIGRAASQFISPGIIAKDQGINPKIDSELRRLNDYGLTKQFPTMVPNYIEKTQSHPRITLTPSETTQFQKRVGELTLSSFNKVINKSSYSNAKDNKKKNKTADEIRAELLATAIEDAKAQAKKEILKSKGLK